MMRKVGSIWYLHFPPQGPGLSQQIRRRLRGRKVGTFASLNTLKIPPICLIEYFVEYFENPSHLPH